MFKELYSPNHRKDAVIIFDNDVDLINKDDSLFGLLQYIFAFNYKIKVYTLTDRNIEDVLQEIAKLDKPFVVAFGKAVTPIEAALDKTKNYIRRVFIQPTIDKKTVQSLMGNVSDYDKENTFLIYFLEETENWVAPNVERLNPLIKRYLKKHPKFLPRSGSVNELNGLMALHYYLLHMGCEPCSSDDWERMMQKITA